MNGARVRPGHDFCRACLLTSCRLDRSWPGAISEADHVNSIIAAGRADLCAVARPHLANPSWTLLEAAKIGYLDLAWPKQYRAAKSQLERNLERERAAAAQSAGLSPQEQANLAQGV